MLKDGSGYIYGYARASTLKQDDSPEIQKRIIAKYVEACELGKIDGEYVDIATSGKTSMLGRKAGKTLVARLRKGDIVVIAKMDRAFRKLSDFCDTLDHFERIGVKLHICNMMGSGALDMTSPIGVMIAQILATFAEFERKMISQRTKEGMVGVNMNAWKRSGGPGYGQKYDIRTVNGRRQRVIVPDLVELETIKQIVAYRALRNQMPWKEICQIINLRGDKTNAGKTWNVNRVVNAFRWAMKKEQEGASSNE